MRLVNNSNEFNKKLKIAMIGHKRVPSREGGVEIVVQELSIRMVKLGHNVDVYNRKGHHVSGKGYDNISNITLNEYEGVGIITIPTITIKGVSAFVYSVIATLRALFGSYDVIHFHAEGSCAMIWLPHLFGIRTVATIHGLDWKRAKWGRLASEFLRFGEKMAVKYADEVIVLSESIQMYFQDTYGRKTRFIPNGVSRPQIKGIELIEKKWGLKKDEYILFIGRIVPEKGIEYLINAYKNLHTLKKLVIAGGSSDTDDFMIEIKKESELYKGIIFTDFVQGEELEELYSNAYLYVLPSDLEGMPISLLEAMSYGNCCVVSDIPECTEVIEKRAVTFKKGNVDDLTVKLQFLIDNDKNVQQYKNNASSFICSKYDWNEVINDTINLYMK